MDKTAFRNIEMTFWYNTTAKRHFIFRNIKSTLINLLINIAIAVKSSKNHYNSFYTPIIIIGEY